MNNPQSATITLPDAALVTLESEPAIPYPVDLAVMGGSGNAQGWFAEVVLRSTTRKRPSGSVRLTLAGVDVTAERTRAAAHELAIAAWHLKAQADRGNGHVLAQDSVTKKFLREEVAAGDSPRNFGRDVLIESRDDRSLWLISVDDLRHKEQGVRITLNLRTDVPHAGYLFAHVLSADPESVVSAASQAAHDLWFAAQAVPTPL